MFGISIPEWFVFINFLSDKFFFFLCLRAIVFSLFSWDISRGTYSLNPCILRKTCLFFFYQMVTGFCILFYFGSQFCFSELSTYISLFFLQFNVLYSLSMIIALQCGRITFFLHLLHKLKGILPLSEPLKILNLEPILQRERTQKEKNKCINSYIQNLEKWYWWTCLQGRNRDTDVERMVLWTQQGKKRVGQIEKSSIDIPSTYSQLLLLAQRIKLLVFIWNVRAMKISDWNLPCCCWKLASFRTNTEPGRGKRSTGRVIFS